MFGFGQDAGNKIQRLKIYFKSTTFDKFAKYEEISIVLKFSLKLHKFSASAFENLEGKIHKKTKRVFGVYNTKTN